MIVYSEKIVHFIHEIKIQIKLILALDIKLKVVGERFYDKMHDASFPIKVVIFNNKSMLGYFDPNFYELGFHECLMHVDKKLLNNIIKHELAHYIVYTIHGNVVQSHGAEFRAFCLSMGWEEDIYRAEQCLEGYANNVDVIDNSLLRKIQKLMALASSSNLHEAEQAMIKSQQLLMKHNIDSTSYENANSEKISLKRIMKQKKENAKMRSIAHILNTFFVSTVYTRTEEHTYLEICGEAVNVQIAEYVADFLGNELEKLWSLAQATAHLKGMVAKNSFFLGIAKGYCDKIQALKREYNCEIGQALMLIENKLADAKTLIYKRLSAVKRHGNFCQQSSAIGQMMGKQLNINSAISNPSSMAALYLEH